MSQDTVLRVTEDEFKKIKDSLLKSDEEIKVLLTSLKEWIKKEQHLPQNEDDFILERMLFLNKFSVEKTKSKLETYYSARHFIPEYFTNNYPLHPNLQRLMDACYHLPLPSLTDKLQRITLSGIHKDNVEIYPEDYNKLIFSTIETRLKYDACLGEIRIFNFASLNLSTVTRTSPRSVQNLTKFLLGAYSDCVVGIHFINVPGYAQPLITLAKSLLKSKIADRVHIHKDLSSLHKHVSPEFLPKDLGGKLKSIKEMNGDWRKFMESRNDWIIERLSLKSNEKLRVGNPVSSELFGIQGSFRQLVID